MNLRENVVLHLPKQVIWLLCKEWSHLITFLRTILLSKVKISKNIAKDIFQALGLNGTKKKSKLKNKYTYSFFLSRFGIQRTEYTTYSIRSSLYILNNTSTSQFGLPLWWLNYSKFVQLMICLYWPNKIVGRGHPLEFDNEWQLRLMTCCCYCYYWRHLKLC